MRRILVVDDEPVVADTLALILRLNGFEVRTVYAADQALACALEFIPDLLLCDINMPGKDGLELLTEFNRDLPECRILVLTGAESNVNRVRDRAAALHKRIPVLTKPCPPAELLRKAGDLLVA